MYIFCLILIILQYVSWFHSRYWVSWIKVQTPARNFHKNWICFLFNPKTCCLEWIKMNSILTPLWCYKLHEQMLISAILNTDNRTVLAEFSCYCIWLYIYIWLPFTQGYFMPGLVEIGPVVLEKSFKSY